MVKDDKLITPQWWKSLKKIPEKIRSWHNLHNLVSFIATAPALKGPSGGRNRGGWSKFTNDSRVWDPNCAELKFVTTRLRSGVGERLFCSMRAWIWLLTRFRTCYWIDQSHVMTSTLWERVCAPRKCGQCTLLLPKKKLCHKTWTWSSCWTHTKGAPGNGGVLIMEIDILSHATWWWHTNDWIPTSRE